MSAEILPFRTKKLTGFLPEEYRTDKAAHDFRLKANSFLKDAFEDTAPAEYCAPESDPA